MSAIAILIPIYNHEVKELVTSVHQQAIRTKIAFEIICLDDGSQQAFKEKNRQVASLEKVTYEELPENIGRAKIRNLLANKAHYENLLFLDCDVKIVSNNFLENYLHPADGRCVICGGKIFTSSPLPYPYYFRWLYGVCREKKKAAQRQQYPYRSFMSNNFLIPKNIFTQIRFNEQLKGYCHEDTVFGFALQQHNIPVKHIDNPVLHEELEDAAEFIAKSEQALENLKSIAEKDWIKREFQPGVRLLKWYYWTKKNGIEKIILHAYQRFRKNILDNLKSPRPKLWLWDFYKLGYFIALHQPIIANEQKKIA